MKTKTGSSKKIKVPTEIMSTMTAALVGLGMSACKAGPVTTGSTVVSDAIAASDTEDASRKKDDHGSCGGGDHNHDRDDNGDSSSSASDSGSISVDPSPSPSPTTNPVASNDGSCFTQTFTQPTAQGTDKLDLLFVTDTSGSLDQERAEIAEQIDSFVAALPNTVDYQIGVMMAHGSRSDHSGMLWKYKSEPTVLSSAKQTLSQIRSGLKDKLTHAKSDYHSDGGEEGLYSLNRAFDHGKLDSNQAKGFFRKDAALAVVFVSDENDICAQYPSMVKRAADPDGLEIPAYNRDCVNPAITAEGVLARLRAQQAGQPLLVAGIIYNNLDTVPRGGENEFGYGYSDIILQANGLSVDMASADVAGGLRAIGELATIKLNLITEVKLDTTDFDLSTLAVTVDGKAVEFRYEPTTGEVQLLDAGHGASEVSINYCKAPVAESSPSPSPTATVTPDPTPTPTVTATATPEPTSTPEPTPTATAEPTPMPTETATPEPTPTATAEPAPTPTETATPEPTPTATPAPEPTLNPGDTECTDFTCGVFGV